MTVRLAILAACIVLSKAGPAQCQQTDRGARTYHLEATPKTVARGNYDAKTPPALKIKPGDAVEVHTLIETSLNGTFTVFRPKRCPPQLATRRDADPLYRHGYR